MKEIKLEDNQAVLLITLNKETFDFKFVSGFEEKDYLLDNEKLIISLIDMLTNDNDFFEKVSRNSANLFQEPTIH